jgi:hypothetical protein
MRTVAMALALGLGLVPFRATEAAADPPSESFCIDFSAFCDCLSVNAFTDQVGPNAVRRFFGTWDNQDCAGTQSSLQGSNFDESTFAGELNPALGVSGINWNFTFVFDPSQPHTCFLDLDMFPPPLKVQDDTPCLMVNQSCPADCASFDKPQGLPPSSGLQPGR